MRFKWSVGALTACVVAGSGFLTYHQLRNAPAQRANQLAEMVRNRQWKEVYRARWKSPAGARFALGGAWTEEQYEAYAKKYIEPLGGRIVVKPEAGSINGLTAYQIVIEGKSPSDPPVFANYYMAFPKPGAYHVVRSKEVATQWDYELALDPSTTLRTTANAMFPNATKTKNNIDNPALYEFLLKEGDNLRRMGCQHLYGSSKKDDLTYQLESIEEHARLYKTARNLVPIAAKYGRKMKFPPTAAELAMK